MEQTKLSSLVFEAIKLEINDAIACITLSRTEALNSITPDMLRELALALDQIEAMNGVRVVAITGSGRAFCAGADLKSVKERAEKSGGKVDGSALAFHIEANALLCRIERLPLPVIAAVNGFALAGGLELVLVCDLVVASSDAVFGDVHAKYGLLPGWGGSVRLPRAIGTGRAKQMMFTADHVNAQTAESWGLVHRVVPADKLHEEMMVLATRIASRSPLGLRRMKRLIDDGMAQPQDVALRCEQAMIESHFLSHDRMEGLAAFAEKRPPKFNGR